MPVRLVVSSAALLLLGSTTAAGASTAPTWALPDFCYSTPQVTTVPVEVTVVGSDDDAPTAPAGVGITTHATATANVGCSPATSGGVRGFTMTRTGTATVSGSTSLFAYSWSVSTPGCSKGGVTVGPFTQQCSGTSSTFCAAPGTGPCSATAFSSASVVNITVTLDRADADDSRTITCRYLA